MVCHANIFFIVLSLTLQNYGTEGMPRTPPDPKPSIPFVHMRTCDIIKYYGYPCEIHHVTTKDGYKLELHRIPHSKASNITVKDVAFLQHGLIDSSFTWVMNPPAQSLAYILADHGYDVWMGNSRGNTYSDKHNLLHKSEEKFWDFSFDEMAKFDNPANIDYILQKTGKKQLNYIGHSQGTLIGFAGFSKPSLARKIKLFIALAPVTHVKHMKGLMHFMTYGTGLAKKVLSALGTKNFLPNSWIIKTVADLVCRGISARLCEGLIFLVTGYDPTNLNLDRLPIYTSHTPSGTSVKDVLHFNQLSANDKFQMYDYGWNGNMHRYMQPFPPQYEIHKMKVPVALFVGESDWLATEADISINLRPQLPNIVYDQDIKNWNHMDFVWGTHANEIIYKNVIKLMDGKHP